jgi:hypothetical protein
LEGQSGTGYLATQLFRLLRPNNDLYLAVQVAPDTVDAESTIHSNGATDVFRDEPVVAINRIHESSFDVVLDTIGAWLSRISCFEFHVEVHTGGRQIYDAARRILVHDGFVVSLVGDELGPPSVRKSWQSGLRSLRRALVKKDRKAISYWLPMLAETDRAFVTAFARRS